VAGAPTPTTIPSAFAGSGDPSNVLVLLKCGVDPLTGVPNDAVCFNENDPEDLNWTTLPDPPNVLVLPDLRAPRGPLVAQPTEGQAQEIPYQPTDGSLCVNVLPAGVELNDGSLCCFAHDSVSGYWVQFSFGCDPTCTEDLASQGFCDPFGGCAEGRLPCGSHPHFDENGVEDYYYLTGADIDALLAQMPAEYQLPAWANEAATPVWDAWTQACCGGPTINLNISTNSNPPPPPPSCPVGFHAPPCLASECFGADGCCGPCDPPLPYNNAGSLIGGGTGGGLGGINQDALQPVPTPLSMPLPTQSIAVTACQECLTGDDEILVSDLE
jgi:hypothetical protein